jgi:hypothetical protein
MPAVGFESTIAAGERPQTYALERAAAGTGIYSYMPGTNHVSWVYSVVAVLQLQFMAHVFLMFNVLHFYIITFRSTCAVPIVAVCCSPLIA